MEHLAGAQRRTVVLVIAVGMGLLCGGVHAAETAEQDANWHADFTFLYLMEEVSGAGEDIFFIDLDDDSLLDPGERKIDTAEALVDWGDPLAESLGGRVEIAYLPPEECGWSVAYLGYRAKRDEKWDSPGEDIQPRFGPDADDASLAGLPDFQSAGRVELDLKTDLDSLEVMLQSREWRPAEDVTVRGRVGPRVVLLDDDFDIQGFDDFPPSSDADDRSDLYVDTDNDIFCVQAGLGGRWQVSDSFGLLGDLNAGPYYADMELDTRFREFDGDQDTWSSGDSDHEWGVLAELHVGGELKIRRNMRLHLGYYALWLSDTARAISQILPGQGLDEDAVDVVAFPELQKDDCLFHGASLGLEICW
ncbi:MAG: hypothetical protein R6V05_12645 [Candidatus Brocadiia bacterium]